MSQQFFHGTPRPKEIPNTSIYSVVRSKQFLTTASHSSLTVLSPSAIWRCVSLENLKHPTVHSLGIGDVMSKSFLAVLTQLYFFVAIIILDSATCLSSKLHTVFTQYLCINVLLSSTLTHKEVKCNRVLLQPLHQWCTQYPWGSHSARGPPYLENTKICLGFFWTGFHSSGTRQYSASLLRYIGVPSLIIIKGTKHPVLN